MSKLLIVTVGLPRSGKSTWSRCQGLPMVNKDSIRLALHGEKYLQQAEPMVETLAQLMVRSLFISGHDVVIADETNVTQEARDRWRSVGWTVRFKPVLTPKEVCIARAREIDYEHLVGVIERMDEEWDWPNGVEEDEIMS